ncbi:hypothetical protein GBAR_LOCUS6315 [Geodia barretti]|nr:hypothetical protein GBAR_LOCUS6315 [Geodia barretti]
MSTLETSEGATIPTVLFENLPELPFVDYCPPDQAKAVQPPSPPPLRSTSPPPSSSGSSPSRLPPALPGPSVPVTPNLPSKHNGNPSRNYVWFGLAPADLVRPRQHEEEEDEVLVTSSDSSRSESPSREQALVVSQSEEPGSEVKDTEGTVETNRATSAESQAADTKEKSKVLLKVGRDVVDEIETCLLKGILAFDCAGNAKVLQIHPIRGSLSRYGLKVILNFRRNRDDWSLPQNFYDLIPALTTADNLGDEVFIRHIANELCVHPLKLTMASDIKKVYETGTD